MLAYLGYYAAISGNSSLTFWDKLPVQSSKVEPLKMGPIGSPETSVINYHYSLRNNPEERSSRLFHGGNLKSGKCRKVFKPNEM